MIWSFYNVLFLVGFTLLLPRFLYRMWRRGGYRRYFLQRLAIYSPEVKAALAEHERVWIHAVSVGEFFVALRIMEEMRARQPDIRFVLTTTTSTAHALARNKIQAPDVLLYFPLDFPLVMRKAVRIIQPRFLILVECEFWPNLVRRCRKRNIPIWLVNGRISERSHRGYMRLRLFTSRLLPHIDGFCVQTETDAHRLIDIGAPADRVHVVGSVKYEVASRNAEAEAQVATVLAGLNLPEGTTHLLGGSTWAGEETALLKAYSELRRRFPGLFLTLAPRHVERSAEVIREIESFGMSYVRRSELGGNRPPLSTPVDVLLLDTTGELMSFYSAADLIFIGKSLTQHGGQNIIEPAVYGRPIVVGPHMENFPVIMDDFLQADAIHQISTSDQLLPALAQYIEDRELASKMGERAALLVHEKGGVIKKTLDLIQADLDGSVTVEEEG